DVRQPLLQLLHGRDDVEALPGAGGAGDDVHAAVAQAQRLEDVEADLDLLHRVGGQADTDGVANAGPEQVSHADGGLHRPGPGRAGLGDAHVQRAVDGL